MTKSDFIDSVTDRSGEPRDRVAKVVEAIFGDTGVISRGLSTGERVSLPGFGVFEARTRAARWGRNPNTGERVRIESRVVPAFRAGRKLKEAVGRGPGG